MFAFLDQYKLKTKLPVVFLTISLLPLLMTSLIAEQQAVSALDSQIRNQLTSVTNAKADAIERYAGTIVSQVRTLAANPATVAAMEDFRGSFSSHQERYADDRSTDELRDELASYYRNEFAREYETRNGGQRIDADAYLDALSPAAVALQHAYIQSNPHPLGEKDQLDAASGTIGYNRIHKRYHPSMRRYLNEFGYYDIFLVEPEQGYVVYSVYKELDFATSLSQGPYRNSGLAQAFRAAMSLNGDEDYALIDFQPYTPSYEAPASFIATPVRRGDDTVGVLIFQMPLDAITEVMSDRSGLGETGETYLVGQDGLLRSDTFHNSATYNVVNVFANTAELRMNTKAVEAALGGTSGLIEAANYQGQDTLSAVRPINFGTLPWALISDISSDEAYATERRLVWTVLLATLVVAVIVVLLALAFTRRVLKPVQAIQETMESVVASGDLSLRVQVQGRDELADTATCFNEFADNLQSTIAEANQVVGAVARGDFKQRMVRELKGDLETLRAGVNGSAASVENTMSALGKVMDALARGDFEERMCETVEGDFCKRVDGAMAKMDAALSEISRVLNAVSVGDFNSRVEGEMSGQLAELRDDINRSLDTLTQVFIEVGSSMQRMAVGNFSEDISRRFEGEFNEVAQNINGAQQRLREVTGNIQTVVNEVNQGVGQVSDDNQELRARSESQASALEETAATMEEMTAAIEKSAESANTVMSIASDAQERSIQAQKVATEAVEAMDYVQESSAAIANIIEVIDEIAFQTNLLALNASVEAARAGEHGRGFAVVASEVRNLAQRSANAAKEISDLIKQGSAHVENGSSKVRLTGDTLKTMLDAFNQVNTQVAEVAEALNQQASGIRQVNSSVTSLEEITQKNAALANQTAASVEGIMEKSEALAAEMARFKV